MRYVIFNWVHPDDVAAWERWTPEEQAADVDRHRAWFGKWREHIVGGEELDLPRTVKTLRPGRQGEGIAVTDGPYVETKELSAVSSPSRLLTWTRRSPSPRNGPPWPTSPTRPCRSSPSSRAIRTAAPAQR